MMISGLSNLVILFALIAGNAQDDNKKQSSLLEGEWTMVSGTANGQPMPETMVKTGKRVAKDGETSISFNGQTYFKAKYKVDASTKPRSIDYQMTEGFTKGKTQLGIYELKDDSVTFCFGAPGKPRPTDFTSEAGSERTLSVWKRVKK